MTQPSRPTYARLAGAGYLVIIATGIYAEFFVRSTLIVAGDPGATAAAISASEPLFRSALAAELVMLVFDVLLAGALYVVFRAVSRSLSLTAAFFRLSHAAVVAPNLLLMYIPLLLIGRAAPVSATGGDPLHGLALTLLEAHGYGYAIGLVFFGVHCLLLGYLVLRSGYVPRALGWLLLVAGIGYLVDSFARTLLVDYVGYETVLTLVVFVPAFVAELSFALWLLIRGVPPEEPTTAGSP